MTVWRVSLGVGFDSIRFDFVDWVRVRFHFGCSALPAICASRCDDGVSPLLRSSFLSENLLACFGSILFYSARHDIARCYPKMHGIYYLPSVSNPSCARYGIAMPLWATMHRASHRIQPVSIALAIETKRNDTIYKQQAATNQQQTLRCVAFYPPGCFLLVSKSNPTSYTSTMRRFE